MNRLLLTALAAVSPGISSAQITVGPSREIVDAFYGNITHAAAADVDGDGHPDIIAAENPGARVLWWKNDGNGNFGDKREWLMEDFYWEVIGLADWNGDDLPDIWLRHPGSGHSHSYHVAVNDGSGSFPTITELRGSSGDSGEVLMLADFDGNGKIDVLTTRMLFLSDSDGLFTNAPLASPTLAINANDGIHPESCAFADIDGDESRELLVEHEEQIFLLTHEGNGVYSHDPEPWLDPQAGITRWSIIPAHGENAPRLLVVTDNQEAEIQQLLIHEINPSGEAVLNETLPLASTQNGSWLSWSLPRSIQSGSILITSVSLSETTIHEVILESGTSYLSAIATHPGDANLAHTSQIDLNDDDRPDLFLPLGSYDGLSQTSPDRIVWHAALPAGGFDSAPNVAVKGLANPRIAAVLDMDGDGHTDVLTLEDTLKLAGGYGNEIVIRRNEGNGVSFSRESIPHGRTLAEILAVEDISGDHPHTSPWLEGRMDLLLQTWDAQSSTLRFEWLIQDDDGAFLRWTVVSESSSGLAQKAIWADWDGDKTRDLIYQPHDSTDVFWRKGSGLDFGAEIHLAELPPGAVLCGAVDMNWDGHLDLLCTGMTYPQTSPTLWLGNDGDGVINSQEYLPYSDIEPAGKDIDGDGHEDFHAGGFVIFSRGPDGLEVMSTIAGQHFLDLDGDGDTDILSSAAVLITSGYQEILWHENKGHFASHGLQSPGRNIAPVLWSSRDSMAMGDLDGDGIPDLVVAGAIFTRLEWFRITHAAEPPAFSAWMTETGLTGNSAGPDADWDSDGRSNWSEFLFGSDPASMDLDSSGWPSIDLESGKPRLTFLRRKDAHTFGADYPVWSSSDLKTWLPWESTPAITSEDENYERVHFQTDESEPQRFFRVEIPVQEAE